MRLLHSARRDCRAHCPPASSSYTQACSQQEGLDTMKNLGNTAAVASAGITSSESQHQQISKNKLSCGALPGSRLLVKHA